MENKHVTFTTSLKEMADMNYTMEYLRDFTNNISSVSVHIIDVGVYENGKFRKLEEFN